MQLRQVQAEFRDKKSSDKAALSQKRCKRSLDRDCLGFFFLNEVWRKSWLRYFIAIDD